MSGFQECWDRLDRADAHAKAFTASIGKFINDKPYKVIPKMWNNGKGTIALEPIVPVKPGLFALELGEFFYQLRAALDSSIWKAYERVGITDTPTNLKQVEKIERALYFPIIKKPESFEGATFNRLNLPDKLRVWLRSVQPCFANERLADSNEETVSRALAVVNECASIDRHRHLHIIAAYIHDSTALIRVRPRPARVAYQTTLSPDLFKGEYVIAEFQVVNARGETELAANGNFSLGISIKEIPAIMGDEIGAQLWHLASVTKDVVRTVESHIL